VRLASSVYYIRWNSIQQTVIPPICQISFIANLGQAVAWGGDIQADIAVTDRFTIELSAGYTDARYTRDSRFNSGNVTPIVRDGDAIVGQSGQPGSAFTSAVSLEHTFSLLEREWFIRADYEYHGHPKWVGSTQDGVPTPAPYGTGNTLQYDPANYVLRSTSFASLRAGIRLDHWTVSAFVDNLTNTHVVTNYNWTVNPGVADVGRIERDFTFRPRTIGMTAVYRY